MNLNDFIRKLQEDVKAELGKQVGVLQQKVEEKVIEAVRKVPDVVGVLVSKESPVGAYNKAIVAFVMSALIIVETWTGFNIGVTEGTLVTILGIITPILVYLFPNYPRS